MTGPIYAYVSLFNGVDGQVHGDGSVCVRRDSPRQYSTHEQTHEIICEYAGSVDLGTYEVRDSRGELIGYSVDQAIVGADKRPLGYLLDAGASFVLLYGTGYRVWQIIGTSGKATGLVLALPHMSFLPGKGASLAGGGALLLMKQSGLV